MERYDIVIGPDTSHTKWYIASKDAISRIDAVSMSDFVEKDDQD
jgi:hypothetical protein